MKKYFIKLFALMLSVALAFSAFACGNKPDDRDKDGENGDGKEDTVIVDTDNYLIKDGASDYVVVYSESDFSNIIATSVSELTYFVKQASGVQLPDVKDSQAEAWTEDSKIISLGTTAAARASGAIDDLDVSELKKTGYTIKNVGKSVFLLGGSAYGVLNAVYRFLREQFHFECYAPDEIALDSGVANKKLMDYGNLKFIPDIEWLLAAQGELVNNSIYARRLGFCEEKDYLIPFGGTFYHNFFDVVDPDKIGEEDEYGVIKEEWFSHDSQQLCLTRDLEGLSDYVAAKMRDAYLAYPSSTALGFTQMDGPNMCRCEKCQESIARYGTSSAAYILFMKKCYEKVSADNWFEENFPGQKKLMLLFAYQDTEKAPAHKNADGTFTPNDESLVLYDNMIVHIAPIYAAGYYSYDYEINANDGYDDLFGAWSVLSKNLSLWTYSAFYTNPRWPYFDFNKMAEISAYAKSHNIHTFFEEDHYGTAIVEDWGRLKTFLRGKVAADNDADLEYYTKMWFQNYFKISSVVEIMEDLFKQYTTHYAELIYRYNLRGKCNTVDINKAEYWSEELMTQWINMLNRAYEEIEYLKYSNPTLYKTIEERICLESLSFRFMNYSFSYSAEFTGSGNTLEADYARFGITFAS